MPHWLEFSNFRQKSIESDSAVLPSVHANVLQGNATGRKQFFLQATIHLFQSSNIYKQYIQEATLIWSYPQILSKGNFRIKSGCLDKSG